MPLIFENVYGFSLGNTGLTFWSLVIGAMIALAANRCVPPALDLFLNPR